MISAIDKSLSALTAMGTKMDVTADNIANALTDEFKKSRVTFKEGVTGLVESSTARPSKAKEQCAVPTSHCPSSAAVSQPANLLFYTRNKAIMILYVSGVNLFTQFA